MNGHLKVVSALMEDARVDVNIADKIGRTALHLAVDKGHVEIVKALMARANEKADVDKINNAGLTPLHLAIHNYMTVPNYKKEIVEVLIENNADVNKVNGNAPLHLAVEAKNKEMVEVLMKNKANFYVKDKCKGIPLQYAADSGCTEIVKVLIANKESLNVADENELLLGWAADYGHIEIVKVLLENKTDVNKMDKEGYTPLYRAAKRKHIDVIKTLLEKGADPLLGNQDIETLECVAKVIKDIEYEHPEKTQQEKKQVDAEYEILKHLLLLRGNCSLVDSVEKSTFDNLIWTWFSDMSGLTDDQKKLNAKLLSIIKDVSSVDKDVDTELETFLKDNANNQDLEKVLNLQRGESKLTLLHVISSIDQKEECVKLLLQANANPKLKDDRGKTPLHYATDKNIVSALRREAELNEQDNEDKTPLDIAIENHNYDIEELLLTKEQKVLQESLYKAFGDVDKLEGLLNKYKKNKDFKRILKLHDNEGKLKVLQYVRNIPCEKTKRLLLEAGITESSGREESSFKSRTLWDNLIAQQQEKLETFLGKVSTAKSMKELEQVVKEAMVDGVRLNFAKQGSLYNKKYENKYGFADYVIRRINELKSNSKNREDVEIASNIVCCLVSKGAVLHNIYSKFVIDELEEFEGHKDNMKNASICYNNQAKKFMEVAKGATSGKVKDAKMDNSTLYLEYSENSRVQVAKITDGARELGIIQGEAGYGRNVIKIGKSEVEIITENGKRNYTNLEGSSGMAIIFPTSLGELQVNLYPQDENKIRVEVTDKKKWEDLKNKKEGIGKDCLFGGRSVYEAIEKGYFERHGKMPPLSEQIISPNQQKVPSWCEMEQQRRSGVQKSGPGIW